MLGIKKNSLVLAAFILSFAAVWQMGAHWFEQARVLAANTKVVSTQAEVTEYLDGLGSENAARVEVPTGVFIQSLVFSSSSNVNLTGYIWQKYPVGYPYEKGIIFPEQIASGDTVMKQEYTEMVAHEGAQHELIGWYFDVTVRQSFNYYRYPLDFLTIWLRIWPADFENDANIRLVPDFGSYDDPTARKFGLDADLVQGEWNIDQSFFSYRDVAYDTSFGYPPTADDDLYHELYFNLGAERKFINAFVINLVPLFVVALLLFAGIMTISDDKEQSSRFGFSTSGLIGTCSALFFVVMLSHIQVRAQFAGSGLVYIEYFYLVMYGMILLTALNGYLFSLHRRRALAFLHYEDNFIAKVSFWPVLLWAMLLITWAML
ncbi:hypothetical protein [Yoonia sediminilitoris]|uniref:Neurotransmitter-gated ion-channel n=1 Tax=Yoonia sediminilitoris TaxID=1286148 RepID=A0A2T6KME4_9RHOB|nr:hypothetical protein [Yoonia sediminilitoris]PUB17392.1 hypothetical protein C8N45_102404 [Yoonia sediminilitoris]RCW97687.1 hypothetical protein DFP92_102404 [Yoonia sediminilitoris]